MLGLHSSLSLRHGQLVVRCFREPSQPEWAQSTRQVYIKANSTPVSWCFEPSQPDRVISRPILHLSWLVPSQPDGVISRPILRQTDLHSHLVLHKNDEVAKGQRILLYTLTVYTGIRAAWTHVYTAETCYSLHQNLRCKAAADAYTADTLFFFFSFFFIQHVYIAETFYTLHQNLRYKNARVYSRNRLQLTAESTSQSCTCIQQTCYGLHQNPCCKNTRVYSRDICLELTPEPTSQECTCIQ